MTRLRTTHSHWFFAALAIIAACFCIAFLSRSSLNAWAREQVISNLRDSFASDIEFSALDAVVLPRPRITAKDVVLRYHGRKDIPPLIRIKSFAAQASLLGILRKHVSHAQVEGLQIHIPPRDQRVPIGTGSKPTSGSSAMLLDHLTADNSRLEIDSSKPGEEPLVFEIHHLSMRSVARDRAAPFEATLSNPKPPAEIETKGRFGPWSIEEPSRTPLSATYTFSHANLGVFQGIAGTLSSKGKFSGVLDHIEVDGETDTPDFMVKVSGHPVALHSKFHAIVDGTNGNTTLASVHAEFLKSQVEAHGEIVKAEGAKGRRVSLDVTVNKGRIEDMLRLALKGNERLMVGPVGFHAALELPPGHGDVIDRLRLKGEFGVGSARFTQVNVEEKVKDLSRRAQGEPEKEDAGSAVFDLKGRFQVHSAAVQLSSLSFRVPGAVVQLEGVYGMHDERLDLHGTVRLDAKLSQTTTGFKSFLLKAVDPFFKKKDAGAVVPIKIGGTRADPVYGLDFGHKSFRK